MDKQEQANQKFYQLIIFYKKKICLPSFLKFLDWNRHLPSTKGLSSPQF